MYGVELSDFITTYLKMTEDQFNEKIEDSAKQAVQLEEAVKLIHEPGNENYSVVETNGGYRLISDMEAKSEINKIISFKDRKKEFASRISEQGNLRKMDIKPQERTENKIYNIQDRYAAAERYAEERSRP